GIWTVPLDAFTGIASPVRQVALPTQTFINGLTYAPDGTLYIADSIGGAILQVGPGATTATTWLSAPLLTPTGDTYQGLVIPGVNGLTLHAGSLYASNTSRGLLLRIPLCPNPGTPVVVRTGLGIDDFAIDEDGVVTAALNASNQVVRFTTTGPVTVLADKDHGNIQNPTAVAFGPHHSVYVTS